MKVLLFCAKAFEVMEFSVFVDVLGWARNDFGCDIDVITCGYQKIVKSTFDIPITMDILIQDVHVEEYDALAIPGGFREYGFNDEAFDERTLELIRKFHKANKIIACVCVAAFALAESGILEGKKATTYHLRGGKTQTELSQYIGINVINEPVVVDDMIITSSCPQSAPEVAFMLLALLTNQEIMMKVKRDMGYV